MSQTLPTRPFRRLSALFLVLSAALANPAAADDPPAASRPAYKPGTWKDGEVTVTWRNTPVKRQGFRITLPVAPHAVWHTLTTVDGLKRFFPCDPTIELRPGGLYDIHGGTDNRVLSFVTNEMIAVTGSAPKQFPEVRKTHTLAVITFVAEGTSSTTMQMSCTEWKTGDEWDRAFEYFLGANAMFLNMLHKHLSSPDAGKSAASAPALPRQLRKSVTVAAGPADVFAAFTTTDGIKTFFAPDGKVECRIGGPYEIYFAPSAAPGLRGSDGCTMLAYLPDEMLSFSWSAPPSFSEARDGSKTHVVIRLTPVGDKQTRVELVQEGWPSGGEWGQVYTYFEKAWDFVLTNLQKRFNKGPIDWTSLLKAEPGKTRAN